MRGPESQQQPAGERAVLSEGEALSSGRGASSRGALSSLRGPVLSGGTLSSQGAVLSGGPCPLWGDLVLWGTLSSGGTLSSLRDPVLSGGGDRVLSDGPCPSWGGPFLSAGRAPSPRVLCPPLCGSCRCTWRSSPSPHHLGSVCPVRAGMGEMGIVCSLSST